MNKEMKTRLKELRKTKKKKSGFYQETVEFVEKKVKKLKYKYRYKIAMGNFKFVVMDMILDINNIDKDDYLFSDGFTLNCEFKFDDKFKKMSSLDFDTKEKSDINDMKFRGRYITKLLFYVLKHVDDMIDVVYDECKNYYDSKGKIKYNILNEFVLRLNSFIVTYLSEDASYREHLEDLMEFFLIYKKRYQSVEVMETFREQSEFVREACHTMSYDQDIMINNIMKLAYMMCTGDVKLRKCPKLIEGMRNDDFMDLKEQIGCLGYAIMERTEKESTDLLYQLFSKSYPLYYSKFPDVNELIELNIGTKSLTYLKMILDDFYVNKFIDTLITW